MANLHLETQSHVDLVKEIMQVALFAKIEQLYKGSFLPQATAQEAKLVEFVLRKFTVILSQHLIRGLDFSVLSLAAVKSKFHSYSNTPTLTPSDLFLYENKKQMKNNSDTKNHPGDDDNDDDDVEKNKILTPKDSVVKISNFTLEPIDLGLKDQHSVLLTEITQKERVLQEKMAYIKELLGINMDLDLTRKLLDHEIVIDDLESLPPVLSTGGDKKQQYLININMMPNSNSNQTKQVPEQSKQGPEQSKNNNQNQQKLKNQPNQSINCSNTNNTNINNNNQTKNSSQQLLPHPPQSLPIKMKKQRIFPIESTLSRSTVSSSFSIRLNSSRTRPERLIKLRENIYRLRSTYFYLIFKASLVSTQLQMNNNAFGNMGKALNQFWGENRNGGNINFGNNQGNIGAHTNNRGTNNINLHTINPNNIETVNVNK